MKLDSKYFDSIRAASKREEPVVARKAPPCQWKGCKGHGAHKAPMGRGRDGQYFLFCLDHVRQYNATYNYFDGMSDDEVAEFQKDAIVGHRPTWKAGANAWAHGTKANVRGTAYTGGARVNDPNGFFAWRSRKTQDDGEPRRRAFKPLERKALETLNLNGEATAEIIKARFKELVKRHHPDVNGGDTRSEDKLREVIQAYNYLKQAGLV